jgi:uncharacterized protein (TIGR00255 family)
MTGFGSKEAKISTLGNVRIEIRSTNHKFLETVLHLPEGLLALEERIKKEIEAKIKRGRITCTLSVPEGSPAKVFVNKRLLKNYLAAFKEIKGQFNIPSQPSIDTLLHLPGVLSLAENVGVISQKWPELKRLINQVLDNLVRMRQKEGRALYFYLSRRLKALQALLGRLKHQYKKIIAHKLSQIKTDEERSVFLKDTDITEEVERLAFHLSNFLHRLGASEPIGKELDFIAQEMQREANTISAKSCAAIISGQAVQIKSQIEKLREQVQNIE